MTRGDAAWHAWTSAGQPPGARGRGLAVEVLPFGLREAAAARGVEVGSGWPPGARARSRLEALTDATLAFLVPTRGRSARQRIVNPRRVRGGLQAIATRGREIRALAEAMAESGVSSGTIVTLAVARQLTARVAWGRTGQPNGCCRAPG